MAVRLFEDNRSFDLATLTPSSQSQNLPATNVQNSFRTRVWRSGNTLATETLTVDMGKPVTVDAVILFYTNLDTTTSTPDTNIQVMGNTSNSWGSPAFTANLTQGSITDSQSTENYFYATFGTSPGSPTFRWWRISYTKSSFTQTRDIGRIFMGTTYDFVQPPMDRGGIDIELSDGSNKSKGVGLQTFVEILPQYKIGNLIFPPMGQTDINNLDTIFYRLGQNTNFYVQIDQVDPYQEILYVKLVASHKKKLSVVSPTTQYWDFDFTFEEQL